MVWINLEVSCRNNKIKTNPLCVYNRIHWLAVQFNIFGIKMCTTAQQWKIKDCFHPNSKCFAYTTITYFEHVYQYLHCGESNQPESERFLQWETRPRCLPDLCTYSVHPSNPNPTRSLRTLDNSGIDDNSIQCYRVR